MMLDDVSKMAPPVAASFIKRSPSGHIWLLREPDSVIRTIKSFVVGYARSEHFQRLQLHVLGEALNRYANSFFSFDPDELGVAGNELPRPIAHNTWSVENTAFWFDLYRNGFLSQLGDWLFYSISNARPVDAETIRRILEWNNEEKLLRSLKQLGVVFVLQSYPDDYEWWIAEIEDKGGGNDYELQGPC